MTILSMCLQMIQESVAGTISNLLKRFGARKADKNKHGIADDKSSSSSSSESEVDERDVQTARARQDIFDRYGGNPEALPGPGNWTAMPFRNDRPIMANMYTDDYEVRPGPAMVAYVPPPRMVPPPAPMARPMRDPSGRSRLGSAYEPATMFRAPQSAASFRYDSANPNDRDGSAVPSSSVRRQ